MGEKKTTTTLKVYDEVPIGASSKTVAEYGAASKAGACVLASETLR